MSGFEHFARALSANKGLLQRVINAFLVGRPQSTPDWVEWFRYLVAVWLIGIVALAFVTWLCVRAGVSPTTRFLIYLIVIVLLSLIGGLISSVIGPRQQARLLDLTHDSVHARDMNDAITYWNGGAEELFGWRREEAVGKILHQLLQTVFPIPLENITQTLFRTGRWEGELIHLKRDGTQITVWSRWFLQRDESGRPFGILETNDIAERERNREDAIAPDRGDLFGH
jgi:PAS domain S-box-containing protein